MPLEESEDIIILECLIFVTLLALTQAVHPFIMSLLLIVIALLLGQLLFIIFSIWVTIRLALVFLGGMIVIFLYFVGLTGKIKVITNHLVAVSFIFGRTATLLPSTQGGGVIKIRFLSFIYSSLNIEILTVLVLLLLLNLVIVVELCESFEGSLESTWF